MRLVHFDRDRAEPIARFESVNASSVRLADGTGEAHVFCIHVEPGGSIGEHEAGFGQLFLVMTVNGWVAGPMASASTCAPDRAPSSIEASCTRRGARPE